MSQRRYYHDSRPWTRWWWFNIELYEEDIWHQLDWLKENGFGGVELAFVYPLSGQARGPDWLSPEWSARVAFAKRYCDAIGLGCDFTFGTLWPFGGTFVSEHDSSRTFSGASGQRLGRSWELPEQGRILNHLDPEALARYSDTVGKALEPALKGSKSALFCDSWEVEPEGLWTDGFAQAFEGRFGYDVQPFMPELNQHPDVRYDYRRLLSDLVLDRFYRPFTGASHKLGAYTRVQCLGAPTDLLAAYAAVDVPETEAILFDPEFARIPGSAAALAGQPVVSAEAFTCLYGWKTWPGPGPHQGEEQVGDLKLLADALFANGVNHVFWHGKPYQPQATGLRPQARGLESETQNPKPKTPDGNRFYASVHVGPDGALAPHLAEFNAYMTGVCSAMKQGRTYADVAVYLPIEDQWMKGELPDELKKPSARYHWELQYLRLPAELAGHQPLWVSEHFLSRARFDGGLLCCGEAQYTSLYVDCEWLDSLALAEILRLARAGLPVCLKRLPGSPGRDARGEKREASDKMLRELTSLANVSEEWQQVAKKPPLVSGHDASDFWCRVVGKDLLLFFGHPKSRGLTYPMKLGQWAEAGPEQRSVRLNIGGKTHDLALRFKPSQSLLLRVSRTGAVEPLDITYVPVAR